MNNYDITDNSNDDSNDNSTEYNTVEFDLDNNIMRDIYNNCEDYDDIIDA